MVLEVRATYLLEALLRESEAIEIGGPAQVPRNALPVHVGTPASATTDIVQLSITSRKLL